MMIWFLLNAVCLEGPWSYRYTSLLMEVVMNSRHYSTRSSIPRKRATLGPGSSHKGNNMDSIKRNRGKKKPLTSSHVDGYRCEVLKMYLDVSRCRVDDVKSNAE